MISRPPHVVVVNPGKVQAKTLAELIAAAKANPGKMTYGHAGNGTSHHLAGELFKLLTGTNILAVPYRGAGPAMQDLVAGHVDMMFDGLGSSANQITGGTIRPLGVAASARVKAFPDMPTVAEAGLQGYEVATWYALWAPKGTPPEIVARMTKEVQTALKDPAIVEAWAKNGSDIPDVTGEAFAKVIASDIARWGKVVKDAGVKLEQ
jgi:tripartite-type tricarboxylate transporter receptor subunit TctC